MLLLELLPRTRYILNVLYVTCCLSRYFHCKYLWKNIDILNSLKGASERNFLTSVWHSENSSLVLELMSFLTPSITSSGRMVIQAGVWWGKGVEVGGQDSGSVSSASSVFPLTRAVSLWTLSELGRWRPKQFPFKLLVWGFKIFNLNYSVSIESLIY